MKLWECLNIITTMNFRYLFLENAPSWNVNSCGWVSQFHDQNWKRHSHFIIGLWRSHTVFIFTHVRIKKQGDFGSGHEKVMTCFSLVLESHRIFIVGCGQLIEFWTLILAAVTQKCDNIFDLTKCSYWILCTLNLLLPHFSFVLFNTLHLCLMAPGKCRKICVFCFKYLT